MVFYDILKKADNVIVIESDEDAPLQSESDTQEKNSDVESEDEATQPYAQCAVELSWMMEDMIPQFQLRRS